MNTENNYPNQNGETVLDQPNGAVVNEKSNSEENISPQKAESGTWKKVTMGAVTGIVLGAAGTLLTSSVIAQTTDGEEAEAEAEGDAGSETNNPPYADDTISIATSVSDDMTFSQAFAAAREEVGPGGAFEWRGHVYGTYTAAEWDNMSAQEHAEYGSHFNWSAYEGTSSQDSAQNTSHSSDAEVVAHETAMESAEPHTPEVEVLGVVHDNETGMNIGGVAIDGQEVVFVDVDDDHTFDLAISDLNHDGELQDDEIFDLSDQNLTVEDLVDSANPNDDMMGFNELDDTMYASNPDYVDDADVSDFLA